MNKLLISFAIGLPLLAATPCFAMTHLYHPERRTNTVYVPEVNVFKAGTQYAYWHHRHWHRWHRHHHYRW